MTLATESSGIIPNATSEADSIAVNNLNQYSEAADLNTGRGFAIPGDTIFPGTPGYYGEATPGHRFIPLKKLLMFVTIWNANKAANMLTGRTGSKDIQIRDLIATKDADPAKLVYCSIVKPSAVGANTTEQVSIGTVAAKNCKSISADVLAEAIVNASKRGANYIMFMAEGINREIDAQGFGIGFNTTQAQLHSSDNSKSNVSTGGLGYSHEWSGYIDYPWLQFTYLKVTGMDQLEVIDTLPVSVK